MIIPRWILIKEDEQLLVEGLTKRWVVNGPATFFAPPLIRVTRRKGITLGVTDYLHVRDTMTGEARIERGPKLFFLAATEEVTKTAVAIPLKKNQYVRILNRQTGVIRVERGEQSVYIGPTEETIIGDKAVRDGINIDEDTAVMVRDITTGQTSLITEKQVFIPLPTQEIVHSTERVSLEDHEIVVVKDADGRYTLRRGTDTERAFFLEPYHELVTFRWSSGLHKEQRTLKITHLDTRPKFMWYEFDVRTRDNVELVLGITFFWQIQDAEAMVRTTDDAPGDVCSHARSMMIQAVSRVSLEEFLAEFNSVVRNCIIETDDPFYAERGVKVHAVEVRSITCKDPRTQEILQEIIQETTNRLNRLQQQESKNEVAIKEIQGEIQTEEMRGALLELQRQHARAEALSQGESEAERVRTFLEGLGADLPAADKIALFNLLRKQEILDALAHGSARLFFTPSDVDLRIQT